MICPLQLIMFHKRQNSLIRYFASGYKKDKTANCLAGHGRPVWKRINIVGPRVVNGLIVAGHGRSGPKTFWTVPSLV